MAKYSSAPISELSIALQFGSKLPLTPNSMIELHEKFAAEYPKLELKQPIGPIGGATVPTFQLVSADDIEPRYWFGSRDEYFLIQVQSDLIAFNWRKRTAPGELSTNPYPGFDEMVKRHSAICHTVLRTLAVKEIPAVSAVNLFYDNTWKVDPAKQGAGDIFKFWNKLGIPLLLGPEVKFAAAIKEETLGPLARVDVTALAGTANVLNQQMFVGRLVLSALGFPTNYDDVPAALNKLHDHAHSLFEQVLNDDLRKSWE